MARRVLVVQPYGIGDLLFLTPVLRALRLIPSVEKVDLLLGSRTEAVVSSNPHIDEIMSVDKDLFHRRNAWENSADSLRLFQKLSKNQYDLLLDYSLRGEYGALGILLGIPRRAGFNYKRRGFFHNVRYDLKEGFKGKHVADFVCDLAKKAGVKVRDRFLEFYPGPREQEEAEEIIKTNALVEKRYLVLSVGGGESWGKDAHFKRWPVKYFAAFLGQLKNKMSFDSVVAVGSANENPMVEDLKSLSKLRVINLAGKVPLGVCASVIGRAALFLGNDGGLLHLAHAMKTPVVGVYGPVDPAVYGPYPPAQTAAVIYKEGLDCRPCYQKFRYNSACLQRECLQDLSSDESIRFLEHNSFFEYFETSQSEMRE